MIYLDNAATTYPKPESVYREAERVMRECGGNPGRGSHALSLAAAQEIYRFSFGMVPKFTEWSLVPRAFW